MTQTEGTFTVNTFLNISYMAAVKWIAFKGSSLNLETSNPFEKIPAIPIVTRTTGPFELLTVSMCALIYFISSKSNVLSGLFSTKKYTGPSWMRLVVLIPTYSKIFCNINYYYQVFIQSAKFFKRFKLPKSFKFW